MGFILQCGKILYSRGRSLTHVLTSESNHITLRNSSYDKRHPDHHAKGIWYKKPTKFLVLIRRIKWVFLTIFKNLRLGGSNLYFNCKSTRNFLLIITEALNSAVWIIENRSILRNMKALRLER